MKVVTFKMDDELLKKLELYAINKRLSRSDIIREAIEQFLKSIEEEKLAEGVRLVMRDGSSIDPLHELGCRLRMEVNGNLEITDYKIELYTNNEIDVKPFLESLGFRVIDCSEPRYHWSIGPKPLHPECTQSVYGNLNGKEVEGYAVYEVVDGKKKLRIVKLWYKTGDIRD